MVMGIYYPYLLSLSIYHISEIIICFLNRVRENAMNGMYKQILRAAYVNAAEEVLRRNTKDEGEEA